MAKDPNRHWIEELIFAVVRDGSGGLLEVYGRISKLSYGRALYELVARENPGATIQLKHGARVIRSSDRQDDAAGIPTGALRLMSAMINPPKPLGYDVVVDGQAVAVLPLGEVAAAAAAASRTPPALEICERVAEAQALLEDHVAGGKLTAAELVGRLHQLFAEPGLLDAMHAAGFFPQNTPPPSGSGDR